MNIISHFHLRFQVRRIVRLDWPVAAVESDLFPLNQRLVPLASVGLLLNPDMGLGQLPFGT